MSIPYEAANAVLCAAATAGDAAGARAALDAGADVDCIEQAPNGWGRLTPLHLASKNGHAAVVALLLERGANAVARDVSTFTPLHLAAEKGDVAIVELLLAHGADVNCKYSTPLLLASMRGHLPLAALLLQRGASVNGESVGRSTPLHEAALSGHLAVARLLLDHGADVNAQNAYGGNTPLFNAAWKGHESVVTLLLDRGADPRLRTRNFYTPLLRAAQTGHAAVVAVLLDRGADARDRQYNGLTSLHLALESGHAPVVAVMLDRGMDIYLGYGQDPQRTPLRIAVNAARRGCSGDEFLFPRQRKLELFRRRLDCVQLVLKRGATTAVGSTDRALRKLGTKAAARRCLDSVFTLLWHGVHVEAPTGDAYSAADAVAVKDVQEFAGVSPDLWQELGFRDEEWETVMVQVADIHSTSGANRLAVENMLAEWSRGGLRAWRPDVNALFPAALRADVQAVMLATLGSLDVDDHAGESAAVARRLHNPLRMLHERGVLQPVFQALLHMYMGGPPAPPRAAAQTDRVHGGAPE